MFAKVIVCFSQIQPSLVDGRQNEFEASGDNISQLKSLSKLDNLLKCSFVQFKYFINNSNAANCERVNIFTLPCMCLSGRSSP